MAEEIQTQLVCTTEPRCLCSGEEHDCQCCEGAPPMNRECLDCEAALALVNVDTGEVVIDA